MKTSILAIALALGVSAQTLFAQDRTTVTAKNYDISDNLDLQAVASIFGESRDLEDFERRLNDPSQQISNLDLNQDGQVDYLRVIESVEGNTHLIILQSVLDRDVYQDIATVEVERAGSDIQVQVVGNTYIYGPNYIYEPVYAVTPVIYTNFWVVGYRPYYSSWYWGFYPSYWHYWAPIPVFRYHTHIHQYINVYNHYNYVNVRRSHTAQVLYRDHRSNGWEVRNPGRSFAGRNSGVTNRYDLDRSRTSLRNTDVSRSGQRSTNKSYNATGNRKNTVTNGRGKTATGNTRSQSTVSTRNKSANASDLRKVSSANARSNGNGGNSRNLNAPKSVRSEASLPSNGPSRSQATNAPRASQQTQAPRAQQNTAPRQMSAAIPRGQQQSQAPRMQSQAPARQQSAPRMQQSAPVQRQIQAQPRQQSGSGQRGEGGRGEGGRGR